MVEVGIHAIKKQNVIKKIARVFPNVLFFVGYPTTEYIPGVIPDQCTEKCIFLQEEEHPGRTRLLLPHPQSQSEYYAP